jgi:filamentous hemagglutinin family protein
MSRDLSADCNDKTIAAIGRDFMKHTYLALTIPLILGSQLAIANPQGGQVVHGTASFSAPNANVLNVTNSHNAVIQWQNFNIGSGQTTNFIQPSAASSVLNRVVGSNPSQILGNLNSNGKVFLINQHGLLVGEGAHINTAGFFGSTLNITDADFLNGKLKFAGGGLGGINNQGYIHAGEDGNIVLIAPNIENGGVIEVENGNIILAAGESITITSLQNSAIEYQVSSPENSITNLGQIIANEGAASLFAGSLQHSGSIRATGLVQDADGTIRLVATHRNEVSGEVDVSGGQGGKIEILGDVVDIQNGAVVNASGTNGGGEILIGGDQQGLNPEVQNATSTTVASGARVSADAIDTGDGGKVIVFAGNDVHVHGELTARGGVNGGDGGFIETSGLKQLDITAVPDASAVNGLAGEWLIDPENIIITTVTGNIVNPNPAGDPGPANFTPTVINTATTLDVALINTALDNGSNVTINTASAGTTDLGDITLNANIIKTLDGGQANGSVITLIADNDIFINADILDQTSIGSGLAVDLIAGNQITLTNSTIDTGGTTLTLTAAQAFVTGSVQLGGLNSQFTGNNVILNAPLDVSGVLNIGNGFDSIWNFSGSTLTILPAGQVDINANGCGECSNINFANPIINQGSFLVSSIDFIALDNDFNNQGGTLALNSPTNTQVSFGSAVPSTMSFSGGSITSSTGALLSIDSLGVLDAASPLTIAPLVTLTLNEGTINNAQNLTIPDTFIWAGGSISGTGDFITPLSSTVNIVGGSITNASVNGQDAQNRLNWINQGFIDLTGIGVNNGLILNDSTLVNENQFYISAGSNVTLEISDNGNGGVINDLDSLFGIGIAAGIDVTMTTPFTNAGTLFIEFPADTLRLVDQNLTLENGALLMGGGTLSLEDAQQNQVGTLFVNNGGGIAPGVNGAGTINIDGNLVLNPGSSLIYDILNVSVFDRINVASNVAGNGAVTINTTDLFVLWDGPAGQSGGFSNVANNVSASAGNFAGFISCFIPSCMSAQSVSNVNIHEPLNVGNNGVASSMNLTAGSTQETLDFVMGDKSGSVFEWTGAVNNNWNDAGNWSGGVIPGVGNTGANVIIDGNGALQQVNVAGVNIDIAALQTDAHIILGAGGSLSLAEESYIATTYVLDFPATGLDFNGVGATLTGTGLLNTLPGTYQTFIDGSPVTINQWNQSGVFSLESTAGTDLIFNGTLFDNSGVFEIEPISTGNVRLLTTGAFDNSGVIISEADVLMQLTSHALTGKISVELGTFSLLQDLTPAGQVNIASGSVFSLVSGADLSLVSGPIFNGLGTLEIPAGSNLNVSPGAVLNPLLTLSLNGGAINQAENLSMPNIFNWFSGTVSVSGQAQTGFTIGSGQAMTLFGTGDMTFNGGMQNDGLIDFLSAGGDFVLNGTLLNNGQILLNPTAIDADLSGAGTGFLNNSSNGTILKNTAFDTKVSWNTNQSGLLDITDGGFIFEGIMNVNGNGLIRVNNGADFTIAAGGQVVTNTNSDLQLFAQSSLSGAGALSIGPGTSLLGDNSSVSVASTTLFGGSLTANNLTFDGNLIWLAGTVSGSGLTTNAPVILSSGTLDTNWTISPTGTVLWEGTSTDQLTMNPGATITNQGQFTITNFVNTVSAPPTNGVSDRLISGSTGTSFNNQGLLVINSDPLGGAVDPVVFDLAFNNDGGTIAIRSGVFSLNGADLTLDQATDTLQGSGTFVGNVINTAGIVTPGINNASANNFETGTLTIDGDFTQSGTGSLVFDLDSTLSGLLHDSLAVSGQLNAGGSVAFNIINNSSVIEIAALLNSDFQPLSFGTLAGRFDSVVVPPGLNFTFSDTGVVTITSSNTVTPEPEPEPGRDRINSALEDLLKNGKFKYGEMVESMRFVDRKVRLALNDEEEEEERRAPRLVCK